MTDPTGFGRIETQLARLEAKIEALTERVSKIGQLEDRHENNVEELDRLRSDLRAIQEKQLDFVGYLNKLRGAWWAIGICFVLFNVGAGFLVSGFIGDLQNVVAWKSEAAQRIELLYAEHRKGGRFTDAQWLDEKRRIEDRMDREVSRLEGRILRVEAMRYNGDGAEREKMRWLGVSRHRIMPSPPPKPDDEPPETIKCRGC